MKKTNNANIVININVRILRNDMPWCAKKARLAAALGRRDIAYALFRHALRHMKPEEIMLWNLFEDDQSDFYDELKKEFENMDI